MKKWVARVSIRFSDVHGLEPEQVADSLVRDLISEGIDATLDDVEYDSSQTTGPVSAAAGE